MFFLQTLPMYSQEIKRIPMFNVQYADKYYISRADVDPASVACRLWDAAQENNKQLVYRLLVCHDADVNTTYEQAIEGTKLTSPEVNSNERIPNYISEPQELRACIESSQSRLASSKDQTTQHSRIGISSASSERNSDDFDLQGSTLLHIACHKGDIGMVELLLQYGAQVNAVNGWGKTPLHQCTESGHSACAKLLLSRFVANSKPRFSYFL